MKLKIIKGYHLTATNRKLLAYALANKGGAATKRKELQITKNENNIITFYIINREFSELQNKVIDVKNTYIVEVI